MEIKLSVLGTPRSQPRHRSFQKGRFRGTYDPAKRHKQSFLYSVLDQAPDKLFNEPIMVNLIFYFPRPKSHYGTGKDKNKLKLSAPIYHISTPDIDNLQKFVFDALNKVFWRDDSIICKVDACKLYGDVPGTEITIKTIHEREE